MSAQQRQLTENELHRFRSGDEGVLLGLVEALGPGIEAILLAKFPMLRAYVEDLLAESLYRLWVRREDFDPARGSLFSWWAKIAENAARDMLRLGWQRARGQEAASLDGEWPDQQQGAASAADTNAPTGATAAATAETGGAAGAEEAFWQAFSRLSKQDQRILLYCAQVNGEGHWAADLSAELGLSAGAIRTRRVRLVQRLRDELSGRGFLVVPQE